MIHDNMLVLCKDYSDAYLQLVKVSRRCQKRLNLSKSNFGLKKVNFFGYDCESGS